MLLYAQPRSLQMIFLQPFPTSTAKLHITASNAQLCLRFPDSGLFCSVRANAVALCFKSRYTTRMKLWIKYLLGLLLGMVAAFILPLSSAAVRDAVAFLFELAIRVGRYLVLPLLFFGVATAMYKLRMNRLTEKAALWLLVCIILSSILLTVVGLTSILLVKLPRIPISSDQTATPAAVDFKGLLRQLLPFSSFTTLHDGVYLLPAFVFAALAGAGCASDAQAAKPLTALLEASAKVCYAVLSFILEFMMVAMIAIGCYWMLQTRRAFITQTFVPLTVLLLADFVLVVVVLYPLLLRVCCREHHPYRVLYASLSSLLTAFFSGDANLTLLINTKHGRDNLGIHRRVNGISFPLFAIFARGGSALVTTICFVMILRSYSYLGFASNDLLWIFGMALALSFATCALPSGSPLVMLTIMCTAYSRGFDTGYLLLQPAMPLVCSFAAAFDAATAMFCSYFIGLKLNAVEHIPLRKYI